MNTTTTTGSVKVGRWEYPAEQRADGSVVRWSKRDGTGELVAANADAFVVGETDDDFEYAAPEGVVVDPEGTEPAAVTALVGVVAPTSVDYQDLRAVHLAVFNSGIWANHADIQVASATDPAVNLTEKRALELVRYLRKLDLVIEEKSTSADGFATGKPIWSSATNWDEIDEAGSLALFDAAVPTDAVVASHKTRPDKPVNNTHAKPGKSSWAVGTPCPKGHVLTAENRYQMPSGRYQCRDCRAGYPSNI